MYPNFLHFMLTYVVLLTNSNAHLHLTILHTSDVNSRFNQVNNDGLAECVPGENSMIPCFGGMARLGTMIDGIRGERKRSINVLLLDTGDQLLGEFYNIYRGNATAQLMNRLGYDAMAIGNKEMAIGPDALAPFLKMVNFPVVSANLDASREPGLHGLFSKSTVKTYTNKDGSEEYVGIVGYTTERANDKAYVRKAFFTDVIDAVRAEVDALTSQGVDNIIVLGHSWGWRLGDISLDLDIARTVSGVDIVVGGGVDYFQFEGCAPDIDTVSDGFPIVVTPDDDPKGKVLVVHNTFWAKYLGRLNVMFNDDGKIYEWYGNPVLLDQTVEDDPEILAEIEELNERVSNFSNRVVGRTHVVLEGYPRLACRQVECSMGNMITNAMVWKWVTTFNDETVEWNNVAIALFNSGGIRSSMDQGDIRYRDILDVVPFGNTWDTIELQGRYILEMLEHSAAGWNSSGAFLQVAGMRVTYDINKEPYNNRVVDVIVQCTDCDYPEYMPLDTAKMYTIAIPSFLAEGYDGYDFIASNAVNRIVGEEDVSVLVEYIEKFSPIVNGIEGRITITKSTELPEIDECASSPCFWTGFCKDGINSYTCQCRAGYEGTNCELEIDECASSPCLWGGSCEDGINSYTCQCRVGYDGINCELEIDECASSPCLWEGTCENGTDSYTCQCREGYAGANCELEIDECASSPCLWEGSCEDGINSYTCQCRVGYVGTNCELDIDECASSPCLWEGTCEDSINSYTCHCHVGYEGSNCELEIDECTSSPCLWEGICEDSINSYTCQCREGHEGTNCELDTIECNSMPCQNGGTCFEGHLTYFCICESGFYGTECQDTSYACTDDGIVCPSDLSCILPGDLCDGYPHCEYSRNSADETLETAGCTYNCKIYNDFSDVDCTPELPYATTFFPNFITKTVVGFELVENASRQLLVLYQSRTCDIKALSFMCGLTFPSCPFQGQSIIGPCRQVCEDVANIPDCVLAFAKVNINLASICSNLPHVPVPSTDGMCTFY